MKKALGLFSLLLCLFIAGNTAHAFYQWVDENGNVHITDYPPPSKSAPEEPAAPEPAKPKQVVPPPPPVATVPPPAPAPVPAKSPAKLPPSPPAITTAPPKQVPLATPPQTAPVPTTVTQPAPVTLSVPTANLPIPAPFSTSQPMQSPSPAAIMAMVGGFMMIIAGFSIALYLYLSLCLYKIAKKLNLEEAWAAWVPIIQVWPFLSAAGKPIWWFILFFIPIVNLFVGIHIWMCIAENLGRSKWLGLLMVLPLVNFLVMGVLAFSSPEGN